MNGEQKASKATVIKTAIDVPFLVVDIDICLVGGKLSLFLCFSPQHSFITSCYHSIDRF